MIYTIIYKMKNKLYIASGSALSFWVRICAIVLIDITSSCSVVTAHIFLIKQHGLIEKLI
jgi:hypothetical protein